MFHIPPASSEHEEKSEETPVHGQDQEESENSPLLGGGQSSDHSPQSDFDIVGFSPVSTPSSASTLVEDPFVIDSDDELEIL